MYVSNEFLDSLRDKIMKVERKVNSSSLSPGPHFFFFNLCIMAIPFWMTTGIQVTGIIGFKLSWGDKQHKE